MLAFLMLTFVFLAALLVVITFLYNNSKTMTTVPGLPPSSKQDGNSRDIATAGSLHEFLMDLHSRFGPISGFWWGKTYVISIASPELMTQNSNVFDRPWLLFKNFENLLGAKSIQYANGSDGRSRRRMHDKVFAHGKIELYMCYFEECAQAFERKWSSLVEEDHIALSEECFVYAVRSAVHSVMGDFYENEEIFKQFKESYKIVWGHMEYSLVNPFASQDADSKKRYDKELDFFISSVKKAISHRKEKELHLENDLMIDILIRDCTDEEILLADVVTYLIGSFHTTGSLLTWAMYYLATHKEAQDKLYKEVFSVIGENGSVDKHNFSEFVYLIQVIDETLRCSVLGSWTAHVHDFEIELGGHKIPQSTPIIHALGVLLQDEKIWPQPKKFDPERFSPENRKKIPQHAFVPFGCTTKRRCPGYRFTYWHAAVFLATVIRRFEVHMCADQVVSSVYGLVTHPSEEIWVKIKKR